MRRRSSFDLLVSNLGLNNFTDPADDRGVTDEFFCFTANVARPAAARYDRHSLNHSVGAIYIKGILAAIRYGAYGFLTCSVATRTRMFRRPTTNWNERYKPA